MLIFQKKSTAIGDTGAVGGNAQKHVTKDDMKGPDHVITPILRTGVKTAKGNQKIGKFVGLPSATRVSERPHIMLVN